MDVRVDAARRRIPVVVEKINALHRRLDREVVSPVEPRLFCFVETDSAFDGVIGLKTSEQALVLQTRILFASAIAVHLVEPIRDLLRLAIGLLHFRIGES